ncbi:hypothetical protein HAP41_0000006110 [Bradyrhizobium barranii subsp. apii]|uniref:Uncharacterized protein n=1 Tax=Bradyrhizobium barranii subsp. apii TaxID=2819348 RepID=A0A8T5VHP4_9BRAD|nr:MULTISPECIES: hypothetical protein [Bradyrhizobium]UFX44449.1 hypothetical protein HAP47_0036585 [Bradyrhizobium sp. 41S5]UPT88650.1 hypothetical protein HAP41_0000006110 [Bradyrhizobium barranii subsp. apii]UPT96304.1 hypothetical protein J4G48_0046055 [Bradyrhizobium barranii subsp. apii]
MTKDGRKSRGTKGSEVKVLPWRTFKDRRSGIWIEETVAQITETGQPELIESLYRNSIPKDAKFRKLWQLITVNGTRRPDGDLCPCPMCAPNRFLTGTLVWFPDLQCCAFIGNCCADADVLAEADKGMEVRGEEEVRGGLPSREPAAGGSEVGHLGEAEAGRPGGDAGLSEV